jgi:K+-transporting ATPase KdpF subunit
MPEDMSLLDLILGVSLAIGLTAYLIYALIRPEKF